MFFCACACVSHSWSRYVPLTKQKRGTTKQVLIFSYSGINNGKRTCCSLEVAFPELQNLYVQKKGIFEGQAYEHLINLLDPVSGQSMGGSHSRWHSTCASLGALCCVGFDQQPNVGLWRKYWSPSQCCSARVQYLLEEHP